jgi:hypothetical protein
VLGRGWCGGVRWVRECGVGVVVLFGRGRGAWGVGRGVCFFRTIPVGAQYIRGKQQYISIGTLLELSIGRARQFEAVWRALLIVADWRARRFVATRPES